MRPKLIPFFDSALGRSSSNLAHQASSALLRRLIPPRLSVNKILWFLYAGNVTETKGGFKAMAASAYPFHQKRPVPSPLLSLCVSPPEVILGSDTQQQTYCHLLCGLTSPALVDGIRAPYASGLVRAFSLLRSKWEQLCEDIENGSLSSEITDDAMRKAVKNFVCAPRPDLAKRIRECCASDNWHGILRELWPELRYIACVTTGSMEQYYPILKYYAGETVPILCGDYFASECSIGINMDRACPPESTSFVILPTAAYFEFLPFELGTSFEGKRTVDISNVEIGKMYEIAVTTYRGLYRYRLGDIVKIVGFYHSSPRVQFITRAPKGDSEVFTERDLMSAMEGCDQLLRDGHIGKIVEYAGFLDDHLTVFLEISMTEKLAESVCVITRCCALLEENLGSVYKMKREMGDLCPIEISIVSPGSFDELARLAVENGAPANQYKPPKILRNQTLVDSLKASVVIRVSNLE